MGIKRDTSPYDRLGVLTPDSDSDEIVFAFLQALFIDQGVTVQLIQHTLQRCRHDLLDTLLWPKPETAEVGPPPEPEPEPEPEPVKGKRKHR